MPGSTSVTGPEPQGEPRRQKILGCWIVASMARNEWHDVGSQPSVLTGATRVGGGVRVQNLVCVKKFGGSQIYRFYQVLMILTKFSPNSNRFYPILKIQTNLNP
jgi:hypothetical protein